MKEPYTEGLATHGGRKPCVDDPQGRGEASVAVRAGQLSSPEMGLVQGADTVMTSGRQHRRRRYCEAPSGPAGSENLCTHGTSIRENWEIPCSPVQLIGSGPPREGQGRTPGMYERGKSNHLIVPTKLLNKAGQPAAEVVEGRR
ncbi:MAG: hypothetical protein ACYDHP_04155 [Ferrimicrobium sp.]